MSPENTGLQNRSAFLSAVGGTTNHIVLGDGDYLTDNATALSPVGFGGQITMYPRARFVTTGPGMGFRFFDPQDGMTLRGFKVRNGGDRSTYNQSSSTLIIINNRVAGTDRRVTLDNCLSQHSNGAGFVFYGGVRPTVRNSMVQDSGRDGLHFDTSWNATATGYAGVQTGDDSLAYLNNESSDDRSGGYAAQVYIEDSDRARGLTVVGQRDVVIEHFRISRTYASGVYVTEEDSYLTREPSNVTYRHGYIEFAGTLLKGEASGINYTGTLAPHRDSIFYASVGPDVRFQDIRSHAPDRDHVHKGTASAEGYTTLDAAEVDVTVV